MQGVVKVVSMLAHAGLLLVLIGGCTPRLTTPSPTPPSSNRPVSTDAPTATSAPGLDVSWEPLERPGAIGSIAYGARGWVMLEDCGRIICPAAARVWHSTDLIAWAEIALPRSGDVLPISVSANSDSYLVVASDYDDVGEYGEAFTQVWRSSDARSWERVGELRSGACNIAGCPHPTNVGLAPNGSIFVGAIEPREGDPSDPFLSEDGVHWRDAVVAVFSQGNELNRVDIWSVTSTPTDLLLIGWACSRETGCTPTLWASTDGESWVEEQSFGRGWRVGIASDGVRRVATVTTCEPATYPYQCTTDVLTGLPSSVWTNVAPALDLAFPQVVWTGDAFAIVGERLQESVGYVSPDGRTWTEISDVPNIGDSCGEKLLVGGSGVVIFGAAQCAIWRGVVQPAR